MDNATANQLLHMVRTVLHGASGVDAPEDWNPVISESLRQGLLPFVAAYADALSVPPEPEVMSALRSSRNRLAMVSVQQDYAAAEIQSAFEREGLDNLVIKGCVTKRRYPDELLRTMGDVDILYRQAQHKQVRAVMQSLNYRDFDEGRKNDTYRRPPCVSVEMHRMLVPAASDYAEYYRQVWQRCKLLPGCSHTFAMTLEDELIFNIVHLIEHFKEGGAGLRFLVDVYVYRRQPLNEAYLQAEMKRLGIDRFYANVSALTEYWFAETPPALEMPELIRQLGDFFLSSGVYGSPDNAAALAMESGKGAFLRRNVFPPYREMCSMFPWLRSKPWLLPVSWMVRGCRSLRYRKDNVKGQLHRMKTGDREAGKQLKRFYKQCGL